VVTAGVDMYLVLQLMALVLGNAPHENVVGPTLVKFTVDEDERFGSVGDALSLRLVGGELPLDWPLKDWKPPVEIFKVSSGG
jgi:hypothetical protein